MRDVRREGPEEKETMPLACPSPQGPHTRSFKSPAEMGFPGPTKQGYTLSYPGHGPEAPPAALTYP